MKTLGFDFSQSAGFITQDEILAYQDKVLKAHKMLHEGTSPGSEFTGWVDLPLHYDRNEFDNILAAAQDIKANSDIFIVIGIGGSYLGARAAIEALNHSFYNLLPSIKRQAPRIYFVGNNLSSTEIYDLFDVLHDRDISVNVISKSGTTLEPALAFRLFKKFMEQKYGKNKAAKRIYVTTDNYSGVLRKIAFEEGYTSFVIPDDIGGRYSVLTAVGLLPIAVSNADIVEIMEGARAASELYQNTNIEENDCYQYAAARNILYNKGKKIEIMVNYEPSMHYFTEWWKQLFGESEGKDNKGIFPVGLNYTTDLHSLGQFIQEGTKNHFETVINIEKPRHDIIIQNDPDNMDNLNYLAGKTFDHVNKKAMEATIMAHVEGGVPNLKLNVPELNSYYFGSLVYFFEKACAISAYMLGVNPFDQPGVEAYKKNMFAILGKPDLAP